MAQDRPSMPVSFFSMAVGTLAWGHSWQAAAQVWSLPELISCPCITMSFPVMFDWSLVGKT